MSPSSSAPWPKDELDWSRSLMGPMEEWPDPLLFALDLIHRSRQPMIVAWGPRRIMFHNAAYAPILAGKPSAIGRPLDEVFPEAWDLIGAVFGRAEAGESFALEDFRIPITRNGKTQEAWWNFACSPISLTRDEIGGVLCIVHETTRGHLAKAGEHAAQGELVRVMNLVPSLLWKADSFGRTVWQNARLKRLAIANAADASSLWKRIVHPDDLDAVLHELNVAKSEQRPFAKMLRLKVSETEFRWHQARSEPTFDGGGDLIGWYGVATDIQDERDAVRTLSDHEALFSQFAANSADMLWTVDLETLGIERLSRNFDKFWPLETPTTPWLWPQFSASVHEADRPPVEDGFTRARRGEVVKGRFRIVDPRGEIHVLEGTTFPIVAPDDRIRCLGGILRDVTPRVGRIAHVIDVDPGNQNRLVHGLRRMGFDVRAFDTVADFADLASALKPGPILYRNRGLREELARLSGLIKSALPDRPWLVIQNRGQSPREAVEIMKMGAADILEDDVTIDVIAAALTNAATSLRRPTATAAPIIYRLSHRERQILDGLVTGGTNKTIAAALGLSPRTVETHRAHVMERLGVGSLAELVALATSPSFRTTTE